MRVLFAAPDATLRSLFGMVLRDAGYEAMEAWTGVEAWGLLDLQGADFCVLDTGLRLMSTLELARRIRASSRFPGLPIILVADTEPSEEERAAFSKAGVKDWLAKPVEPPTLLKALTAPSGNAATAV